MISLKGSFNWDTTLSHFIRSAKLTRVKEETKTSFHSKDIFKEILEDYKHLEKEFKELSNTAEKEGDKVTVTYADDQLAKLQKSIWMLQAHLA